MNPTGLNTLDHIVERRLYSVALPDRFRRLALFDPDFMLLVRALVQFK